VVVGAAQVLEAGGALQIADEAELRLAARALGEVGRRRGGSAGAIADEAEQGQRAGRRQHQALALVEPERLAGEAEVERHRPAVVAGKGVLVHGRGAAGAVHG
jgi:hypothetical protein